LSTLIHGVYTVHVAVESMVPLWFQSATLLYVESG